LGHVIIGSPLVCEDAGFATRSNSSSEYTPAASPQHAIGTIEAE